MSGIAVGERWLVYFILNNYEVAFALVFLCAGAHKLVSAFLLEVINSSIILAREFCACCALNTLKVPTRYRPLKVPTRYRLRNNGEPALMGAFLEVSGGRARRTGGSFGYGRNRSRSGPGHPFGWHSQLIYPRPIWSTFPTILTDHSQLP